MLWNWVLFSWLSLGLQALQLVPSASAEEQDDSSNLNSVEILLRLYDSAHGLRWSGRTNWLQNNEFCSWYGIVCYGTGEKDERRIGHVKELDLSDNHLVGSLPPEVFDLPYIHSIILRDNPDLIMTFDNLLNAQFLERLIISNTATSTLDGLQRATQLAELHITNLKLMGSFPSEVLALTSLTGLFANFNSFSGEVPSKISLLSDLSELYMFHNDFTGQIPTEIGLLTKLRIITFAQNSFTGTLPTELNQLTRLEIIAFQREEQDAEQPGISGNLPDLSQLSAITEVYFENQMLTGTIPSDFLGSAPTNQVVKVNLSNNRLTGEVPLALSEVKLMRMFLANNMIRNVSAALCDEIATWMGGDVDELSCDAFLCPPMTYAAEGRETMTGRCLPCGSALYYGTTKCSEKEDDDKPATPVNERQILVEFYNVMGGRLWKEDGSWLNPAVDVCSWYGINCFNGNITSITLKNNGLANTLPDNIFTLPELTELNLHANSIEFSFKEVGKARNLVFLDLTHTDLRSLADVEELAKTSIERLKLGSNFLVGELPLSIFTLTGLKELHLSHNRFTGSLPSDVGMLTNLEKLEIYGNELVGRLPSELGLLSNLQELVLGENSFTGSLPQDLDGLTNLRTLALHQTTSSSGIGGGLLSFRNLRKLTTLHLESNSLSGTLPDDLLQNTESGDERIELRLGSNRLSGAIPSSWESRFEDLIVDLAGNQMTSIPPSFCQLDNWMDGAVANYQCKAILCPVGTFNEFGRQTDDASKCRDCPDGGQFLGVKSCSQNQGESEIEILKELYFSTNGAAWTNKDGWVDSQDYCNDWFGIECDSGGSVKSILLENNGLTGTPRPSLFLLTALTVLNLRGNQINFHFDGIGAAISLENLLLSDTSIESIAGIGKATTLTSLHLTDNDLTGTLPGELFQLTRLEELFLNYNRFSGRIPMEIAQLVNIEELYLFSNRLEGQIPAAVSALKKLRVLALTANFLSGTLPEELNDLVSLEVLAVQRERGDSESGAVTNNEASQSARTGIRGPLPPLNKLPNLKQLYLGANSLTGSIPFNFLDGITDKTAPIVIDLISNSLTGRIPASLTQFDNMTLFLADNQITDLANGLCLKFDWMGGDVRDFGCNAILCPPNSASKFGRQSAGTLFCEVCDEGTSAPYYGSFECLSADESQAFDERDILVEFFMATDGDSWNVKTNWLSSDASFCSWYGVTCVSGSEESVQSLHLSQNSLAGTVPSSLFNLTNLIDINFSGNNVTLNFEDVDEPWSVQYMDLDNTDLISLAGIADATSDLQFLHLDNNNLVDFPLDVFHLTFLKALSISNNRFTGEFPAPLTLLRRLVSLACNNCGFNGTLPTELGRLSHLEYFSFAGNSFSGELPSDLLDLSTLKHLDLSDQTSTGGPGLYGNLPDFAGMPQLTELLLFRNHFAGSIPATFLNDVNNTDLVTVDLRDNDITGSIPPEISSRIAEMDIYLANNRIDNIPQEVCDTDWNGWSGTSSTTCDHILCAVGTFNPIGRAIANEPCQPCPFANYTDFFGSTQCGEELELDILSVLYVDLGGPEWKKSEGWLVDPDFCNWYGVTCHDGGEPRHVKWLMLPKNKLVGTVTPAIFELQHMELLDLRQNKIIMDFSNIANAQALQTLHLSQTRLESIEGIGNAVSLTALHLTSNSLMGTIPDEILNLDKLERLYMNYNKYSGNLTTRIAEMTTLKELYLFHNELSGSIPSEIGLLTNLEVLGLGENNFVGSLPTEFSRLTNLQTLSVQQESGSVLPGVGAVHGSRDGLTGTVPALNTFPRLQNVFMGRNSFTGSLPPNFIGGISNKSLSVRIDLTMNLITGTVPESLADFDDLWLFLAGNLIENVPAAICAKQDWMGGFLSSGCQAFLCPPGTFNGYGRSISTDRPCDVCTVNNKYYGAISCDLPGDDSGLDERSILFQLYTATNGVDWRNKDNWLEDDVSICDWHGIHCASEDGLAGETVTKIELPANGLTQTVPAVVFHLPSLKILNLGRNKVDLSFSGIEFSSTLEQLFLDSTDIESLRGIGGASALRILNLADNAFAGTSLPDELFDIVTLEQLYLSNSGFSGTLSTKIGKLTNLEQLYCHKNDITGTLPTELGSLPTIEVLQLSENRFVGNLPYELDLLTSLRSFFIDSFTRNSAGISGPLLSFESLSNLQDVYIGSNSLTGTIPSAFLASVPSDTMVTVGLGGNRLTGTLPAELARINKLNIDLAGNKIDTIDQALCDKSLWNQGAVNDFGCDGILCPVGFFNQLGRQASVNYPCIACGGPGSSPYLGSVTCPAIQKQREREILELLYQVTGGPNWKKKDGWLDDNVDICQWYGVNCRSSLTVESILLGTNNLVGTPPKQIFELPNLRFLWLYGNPITFSFEGIEKATLLLSILLDSTGLESIEGIGKAAALVDIDVRFNKLKGTLPSELRNLRDLTSFSCSHNMLTGTVPSFASNQGLATLRLGTNAFTGTLPSFRTHTNMVTLDVSENELVGTIPSDLLASANTAPGIFLDLSSNMLTGTIPGALNRFSQMTLYAKDNWINGIDPQLCSKSLWNDGDVGIYGCDGILCTPGYFSPGIGRSSNESTTCSLCDQAKFYGSLRCGNSGASSVYRSTWSMMSSISSVLGFVLVFQLWFF